MAIALAVHTDAPSCILSELDARRAPRVHRFIGVVTAGFGGSFPIADYLRDAADSLQN